MQVHTDPWAKELPWDHIDIFKKSSPKATTEPSHTDPNANNILTYVDLQSNQIKEIFFIPLTTVEQFNFSPLPSPSFAHHQDLLSLNSSCSEQAPLPSPKMQVLSHGAHYNLIDVGLHQNHGNYLITSKTRWTAGFIPLPFFFLCTACTKISSNNCSGRPPLPPPQMQILPLLLADTNLPLVLQSWQRLGVALRVGLWQ